MPDSTRNPTVAAAMPLGSADDDVAIHHMPGHQIRRLQQLAVALFVKALQPRDITPVQYAVLATLAQCSPISQATLSGLIAYDRATIGGVVDRLAAKGWVDRTLDADDRRLRMLALNKAGARLLKTIRPRVEQVQDELLAPLSEAERRNFEALCLKLLAHHGG